MENSLLIKKIALLPNSLKVEVSNFVDYLLSKKEQVNTNKLDSFSGIWNEKEAKEIEMAITNDTKTLQILKT